MFLKKNLRFFLAIFIFFGYIENSFSIEPSEFIQLTVNRASKALDNNHSKETKIEKLKVIAKETVDIRGIGFYTLGSHRKNLTDNQKKNILNFLRNIS